jgi:hypothetical protein
MEIIYRYRQDPSGTNDIYDKSYRFIAERKEQHNKAPELGQKLNFFFKDEETPSLDRNETFVVAELSYDDINGTVIVVLRNDSEGVMAKSAYIDNGWKIIKEWIRKKRK